MEVLPAHPFHHPGLLLRHEHDHGVEGRAMLPSDWSTLWDGGAELLMTEHGDRLSAKSSKH